MSYKGFIDFARILRKNKQIKIETDIDCIKRFAEISDATKDLIKRERYGENYETEETSNIDFDVNDDNDVGKSRCKSKDDKYG